VFVRRELDLDFSTFALCIADSTGTPGKKRKEVGLMRMVEWFIGLLKLEFCTNLVACFRFLNGNL